MESTMPFDDRASGSPKRDGSLSQAAASSRYVESGITIVRRGASEEERAPDGVASATDGEAGLRREEGSDRLPEGVQVTGAVQAKAAAPAWKNRLSTRIVISSVVALSLVLSMVGWTLWLSWQLAGTAAAINETGSLRMRANRIGLNLLRHDEAAQAQVVVDLREQGRILAHFAGDLPGRPLFLSTDAPLRQQFHAVTTRWDQLADLAHEALEEGDSTAYLAQLPGFVAEADRLVHVLEVGNASKTTRLRILQSVLIVMACLGTMAMIFLLYRWIIRPVQTLQGGIQRMAARDFSVRVPVNNTDELGVLAQGFNRMADELQSLYEDLGEHVRQKTAELERQNRQLSALYGMTAFLNKPNDIEALCRGFLQRVMDEFHAAAGSIRVLDPSGERLHIVVSLGFSSALQESEHCMRTDACFCGEATQRGTMIIRDFRKLPRPEEIGCMRDGFQAVSVFQIVTPEATLGTFSLHFRERTTMSPRELQLLEMLGQHLGAALDNQRLSIKARQLAVAEERNLVAQGLHDSLAQGLNFLNLQTQMLGSAVQQRRWDEVEEIVPLLKTGVSESYQDVRELLQNFRTRLGEESLRKAVDDTIGRFRRQTGLNVELHLDDRDGAPLHPDQQLQVLFILQEALSNVRKHAYASKVTVRIDNHRDFGMSIRDDGEGYDPQEVAERSETHVGLSIMRERAARLGGQLQMCSAPGQGTEVSLYLSQSDRLAS
ncbi:MAG: type IV pili methyl-accepting chemotaxis transducer N-terminal domain-containing protein [Lautropia mirabilis]|jgi:nitrate/nitrite sensor histidine kinase narX|nr:type IV pili methyl-accepting chemotaxis transducer N-terminal domain-containing protein [Lautropia mirabilis]MBF1248104.1 type IV pili methyl-accepting chemotaxis transducer N-terminal domain-containing protein [Lautropia mirabilis]